MTYVMPISSIIASILDMQELFDNKSCSNSTSMDKKQSTKVLYERFSEMFYSSSQTKNSKIIVKYHRKQ